MPKFNRDALINDANALDVARAIGMNVVKRGSKYFIPCPGHEQRLGKADTHATNAVLTPKGYYCYACDAKVGLIDMVMEFLKCDVKTALETIADTCGGTSFYRNQAGDADAKRMPLTQEDLKLLGFIGANNGASTKKLINASMSEPLLLEDGHYFQKEGNEYFIYEKCEGWSLQRLYRHNEKKFYNVIAFKAREAMNKYQKAMQVFCKRDAEQANTVFNLFSTEDGIDGSVFVGLKASYQKKYWRCKEIMEEFMEKAGRPIR